MKNGEQVDYLEGQRQYGRGVLILLEEGTKKKMVIKKMVNGGH